ncbi:hypothetical protein IFT48_04145 [Pseudomonas fluorescens]|uniref:hypothetical protein n=1 Tax=Pseudomonas fluorescens TaxID=294 RepID=UPI00193094CC|nr:hypothetical protein [Pseudomonas fluorescens]MBD8089163.1 hypothetical protein [Pseudomonas fluorescens]
MQRLKDRATREELFEADEFADDWETHQAWRIEQTKQRAAERLSIPVESVRLTFTHRMQLELMNRKREQAMYRPQGVVTAILPSYGQGIKFVEFEVSWLDCWGYPHRSTKSFMEIILSATDEVSYRRQLREIREAQQKLRVQPLVQ